MKYFDSGRALPSIADLAGARTLRYVGSRPDAGSASRHLYRADRGDLRVEVSLDEDCAIVVTIEPDYVSAGADPMRDVQAIADAMYGVGDIDALWDYPGRYSVTLVPHGSMGTMAALEELAALGCGSGDRRFTPTTVGTTPMPPSSLCA